MNARPGGLVPVDVPTLVDPSRHPLRPALVAGELGATVVIAPHPDDETLGCGGLLGLLADASARVEVVVMTDGSRSHPQSRAYPPARLAAVREQETLNALAALGLPPRCARFLRHPDCGLPAPGTAAFEEATDRLQVLLDDFAPDTIVVPWRRDPHCDHEASWRLTHAATRRLRAAPRWLEFPVWAWMQPSDAPAPGPSDGPAWRLDISSVVRRKINAIAAYPSQLGMLIHDDPTGFVLDETVLAQFHHPWELFVEPHLDVDG